MSRQVLVEPLEGAWDAVSGAAEVAPEMSDLLTGGIKGVPEEEQSAKAHEGADAK